MLSGTEIANSIEAYLKAAGEGVVAAQFVVGLAHLEGYGVERDDLTAYYWLRMAEENSCTVRRRSHALVEELRSRLKTDHIEAVEDSVATGVQENKLLRSKRPAELIKLSADSTPREFSICRKSKVAS